MRPSFAALRLGVKKEKGLVHAKPRRREGFRHCEELCDEEIQWRASGLDCFAALSMT
jgi:hypothetical protein